MENAAKVPGVELLKVGGARYEWNPTFGAYWSTTGEPRALQASEVPKSFRISKGADTIGKYYGIIHTDRANKEHLESLGSEIAGYDEGRGGFIVAMTEASLSAVSEFVADYRKDVTFRSDDAGQTPHAEMTPQQLVAEIAYYDFMIAASQPYSPNTGVTDAWYAANGGFPSAPRIPSAATFMDLKREAKALLVKMEDLQQQADVSGVRRGKDEPTP